MIYVPYVVPVYEDCATFLSNFYSDDHPFFSDMPRLRTENK